MTRQPRPEIAAVLFFAAIAGWSNARHRNRSIRLSLIVAVDLIGIDEILPHII